MSPIQRRVAAHSATLQCVAPNQTIRRGMPLDRIGVYHTAERSNIPIYARHPDPRANGAGPHSVAASDVTTGEERGEVHVIDAGGEFRVDALVLPDGMSVLDGQLIGVVRAIDVYSWGT